MMTTTERAQRRAAMKARNERIAKAQAEMREHVARGTCPDCGSELKRNSSMSGWWQCARYGSDAFREPKYRGLPSCSFQGFTE